MKFFQRISYKRFAWAIFAFCVAGVVLLVLNQRLVNDPAHLARSAVSAELADWFASSKAPEKKSLATVGNVSWDWVCFPGYYTDGLHTAQKGLLQRGKSFSGDGFDNADEYFYDAENGLTFISFQQKLLITVPVEAHLYFEPFVASKKGTLCTPGDKAFIGNGPSIKGQSINITEH